MKAKGAKSRSASRARVAKKVSKRVAGTKVSRKDSSVNVIPGQIILGEGDIVAFKDRQTVEVLVANTGDRPIQVGSHCHFFEANRALRFDRAQAFGMRLNVAAGTAVRFEPGDAKRVTLVELAGARQVHGLNGLTAGGTKAAALGRLADWERPA